jgi:hypothetical protein
VTTQETAEYRLTVVMSTELGELPSTDAIEDMITSQLGGELDDATGLRCIAVELLIDQHVYMATYDYPEEQDGSEFGILGICVDEQLAWSLVLDAIVNDLDDLEDQDDASAQVQREAWIWEVEQAIEHQVAVYLFCDDNKHTKTFVFDWDGCRYRVCRRPLIGVNE